jgi:glutamate-1-semialdehyde 2,1-aminomutase
VLQDRYQESKRLLERARQSLAGGVSSPFRAKLPVPLYFRDGSGPRLWDADGNEYIDYALAWGPLILGHKHPALVDAIRRQADQPHNYGAQHELEYQVAEMVQAIVPCAERVLFTSSGTEAVHIACRLARAATGRRLILRFEGHYHGWLDPILWSYQPTAGQIQSSEGRPVPGSAGQTSSDAENLLVASWNDLAAVEHLFATHGAEIAAVITEPILCNSGGILPEPGYLEGLRRLTSDYGALLIFDEVITGFRVALGGAQQLLGVTPDMATFGKAIAGGATLSVVAGRGDVIERVGNGVAFGGTFNGNSLSLGAARATIEQLSHDDGAALRRARQTGERLMEGIRSAARQSGIPLQVLGHGTCFWLHFTDCAPARCYRDTLNNSRDVIDRYLRLMLDEGILLLPQGRVYVSAVHGDKEVEQTLRAVQAVFARLP